MDKQAENTFAAGLNTDRHPLTSQTNELTNARNVDLIAIGEGYQLILQKREGNAELFFLPSAWSKLARYAINEYVTESGITYKSTYNGNNIGNQPSISPVVWQPQANTLVSAGLRPGFIPLAVKEFNEVAYIISANPATLEGEIGTFPSPDYTQFLYVTGAVIPGEVSIGAGIYDPRSNPPSYEYNIAPVANSGQDEAVIASDLTAPFTLIKGGFRINNTGEFPDTYTLTRSIVNANVVTKVNGIAYTYGSSTISINPGAFADVTFEIQHPFIATYYAADTYNIGTYVTDGVNLYISLVNNNTGHTPASSPLSWQNIVAITDYALNLVVDTTITITPVGSLVVSTYEFIYHIAPSLAVRYQTESIYHFGSIGDTLHTVPQTGGDVVFEWISNDTGTVGSTVGFATIPANVGNSPTALNHQLDIHFVSNPIPQLCRTVNGFNLKVTGTAVSTMSVYADQYPHP